MVSPRKLLAGVARIDITPPIGIELFGYHRPSPMTDIHDPLWLTVLALVDEYDPSQPYLLLAIDNIGLGQEATHHLRKAVAATAKTSLERVIIYYSHNRSPFGNKQPCLLLMIVPSSPCFGGYTNGITGYLAPAMDYPAGGYEIEWMPIVYGYYEGMLTPPVPEASEMVVASAVRLATQLWSKQ